MSTPFHPNRFKLAYGGLIAIALAAGGRYGILKHFRGVSEFAQSEDDGAIPGARMYLGEVVAAAQRPLLS